VPGTDCTGGFGDINAVPSTAADVQPVYRRTVGNIELDLTQLDTSAPVATEIYNGAGTTTVLVPASADVRFSCRVQAGDVDCLGHRTNGMGGPVVTGTDRGSGGADAPQITVDITQDAGKVEVRRD
jgi:predicted membrane protein